MDGAEAEEKRPSLRSSAASDVVAVEDAELTELATLWVPMAQCRGASDEQLQRVKRAAAAAASAQEVEEKGEGEESEVRREDSDVAAPQQRTPEEVAAFIQQLKEKQGLVEATEPEQAL